MSAILALCTTFKLFVEIALLALAGQSILGWLAVDGKGFKPVCRVLQQVGKPWIRAARCCSTRVVLDRHLPWVAVLLLVLIWLVATVGKVGVCLKIGVSPCR